MTSARGAGGAVGVVARGAGSSAAEATVTTSAVAGVSLRS